MRLAKQSEEVVRRRGAGEGDGVEPLTDGQQILEGRERAGWNCIAVRRSYGEQGAGGGQGLGKGVAGLFGAGEQKAGWGSIRPAGMGQKRGGQAFGYRLLGEEIDREPVVRESGGRCRTDGGDTLPSSEEDGIDAEFGGTAKEERDRVAAGEEEPVEGGERAQGGVESSIGGWGADLNQRKQNRLRTQVAEVSTECRALRAGSGDENARLRPLGHGLILGRFGRRP